jgi:hypothetical protein
VHGSEVDNDNITPYDIEVAGFVRNSDIADGIVINEPSRNNHSDNDMYCIPSESYDDDDAGDANGYHAKTRLDPCVRCVVDGESARG